VVSEICNGDPVQLPTSYRPGIVADYSLEGWLPFYLVACEFAAALLFAAILDGVKIPVFARPHISQMFLRGSCKAAAPVILDR